MATSFTYTTLKTAIKDHVEDQGTDFGAAIDILIKLGEDRVLKDLPLAMFDSRQNVTLTAGTQTATKPTDAIATRELYYTSGGQRVILEPRTYNFCIAFCADTTQRAPRYFAEDYSETAYWLAPNPNLSITAEALITKRPASIVSAATTFLGTNVGDLLFASCMIDAERFNIATENVKDWQGEYADKLQSARIDLRHLLRRDFATLAPMPMAAGKGER